MPITTSWLKPVPAITGQDHIGTIAPAESIYVAQLPGITNVTARARYYSFYPWFFREIERRHPAIDPDELVDRLRRAECVFALAAEQHGRTLGEDAALHGATMVGRDALVPSLETAGERGGRLPLALHASQEDTRLRYFKNRLGGLGQYYFGPLREIGILGGDTRTSDIKYTEERGLPLAEAFGSTVDGDRFFGMLDREEVTTTDLDALAAFCPCALARSSTERRGLVNLLADPSGKLGDEARARRDTIALVLDLAGQTAAPEYDFSGEFRASTYAGALLSGSPWMPSEKLKASLAAWAVYTEHELLSIAFQGLMWAALVAAEGAGKRRFRDAPDLAEFACAQLKPALSAQDGNQHFARFVEAHAPPALAAWSDEKHEVQAGWRIVERSATPQSVTIDALTILAALAARASNDDPYLRLHFEADYFDRYPINLRSFLQRAREGWAALPMRAVLKDCLVWVLRTHWRVALQKLGDSSSRDTFKVRPLDGGVQIVEAPVRTFSVPRIHRVVGLLRDLLLVQELDARPVLTAEGKKLRGVLLA